MARAKHSRLRALARAVAWPVVRYIRTVKTWTFADFVYNAFVIAQNFCQSVIYWNICKLYLGNDIPLTVVLTGSMEPGFNRGDVMAVQSWNDNRDIAVGNIVVWQQQTRPVPIVHRLLEKRTLMWPPANASDVSRHKYRGDDQPPREQHAYITKGDANADHDTALYDYTGRDFMLRENLLGGLLGNAPGIGFMTIAFKENKWFKLYFYSMVILSGLIGYPEG